MEPRIRLVSIVEERHTELLFKWRSLPEIARNMYGRRPIVWKDHVQWVKSLGGQSNRIDWIIELDGVPVGTTNLVAIDREHGRADFGMYVADPTARVQGTGAAAEWLTLRHAFHSERLHKVSCEVFRSNASAVTLHQRLGFAIEGELRDHVFDGHSYADVVRLSLLENEWKGAEHPMYPMICRLTEPRRSQATIAG